MQGSTETIIYNKIIAELERAEQEKQQKSNVCSIVGISLQKMTPLIANTIEQKLQNVKWLNIIKCGLRNLQGFPRLKSLENIDVSQNQLLGSFQFLARYQRTLKYINVSSNQIMDIQKFQVFRNFNSIYVYARNNPFCADKPRQQFKKIVLKLKQFRAVLLEKPKLMRKPKPAEVPPIETANKLSQASEQVQESKNCKQQSINYQYSRQQVNQIRYRQQRKQAHQQENVFPSLRTIIRRDRMQHLQRQDRQIILRIRGMRQKYLYRTSRRQPPQGFFSRDRDQQGQDAELRDRQRRYERIYEAINQHESSEVNRQFSNDQQPDRNQQNRQDLNRTDRTVYLARRSLGSPSYGASYENEQQANQEEDDEDDESFSSDQTEKSDEDNQEVSAQGENKQK